MNTISNPLDPENPLPAKTIVIVGMPGSGKSSVGPKLASKLGLPFFDSDVEIEAAAKMPVKQIIEDFGEPEFRQVEKRVIKRLMGGDLCVISTGGGAFINDETRALVKEMAVSIWLRADIEELFKRVSRNSNRPLLKGEGDEPRRKLEELFATREPFYAQADLVVNSDSRPVDEAVMRALRALDEFARKK